MSEPGSFQKSVSLAIKRVCGVIQEKPTLAASAEEFNSCMGLGPFANIISAQGVAERLEAIGLMVELIAVD